MMTLVDKSLLGKFYYLNQKSAAALLRDFRTKKKMKKGQVQSEYMLSGAI